MAQSGSSVAHQRSGSRTPAAIEAEMAVTRERLVGTIAQIEERVKPANVAARSKRKIHAFYTDDAGEVRWDRVAMTAGATVGGLLTLRITSRTLRWAFAVPTRVKLPRGTVYVPVPRDQLGVIQASITA